QRVLLDAGFEVGKSHVERQPFDRQDLPVEGQRERREAEIGASAFPPVAVEVLPSLDAVDVRPQQAQPCLVRVHLTPLDTNYLRPSIPRQVFAGGRMPRNSQSPPNAVDSTSSE